MSGAESTWPPSPPSRRPLTAGARRERQEFERINDANGKMLRPSIEVHVTGYDAALDELEWAHRKVADETALDLDAATREAALWLITGRCIGLARAARDLAVAGYATEVISLLRSLHEASRLLNVFTHPGEERLVRRWLEGRNVSRGDVMAAVDRQEAARAEMLKQGVAPLGTTGNYFDRQYGRWSEFAHHRRHHMLSQVSVPARMMVTGPHPDWRVRAATVDHFGWCLLDLVSTGGSALARLWGPDWFYGRFQPTFRALSELRDRVPLTSIAAEESPRRPGR
jgi:hypothetical protein